jgi:hypothetical protein
MRTAKDVLGVVVSEMWLHEAKDACAKKWGISPEEAAVLVREAVAAGLINLVENGSRVCPKTTCHHVWERARQRRGSELHGWRCKVCRAFKAR